MMKRVPRAHSKRFLRALSKMTDGQWSQRAERNGRGWIGTAWTETFALNGRDAFRIVGGSIPPEIYYDPDVITY